MFAAIDCLLKGTTETTSNVMNLMMLAPKN